MKNIIKTAFICTTFFLVYTIFNYNPKIETQIFLNEVEIISSYHTYEIPEVKKLIPKSVNIIKPTENENALETFYGVVSAYGPDCTGCNSNKTASGYYVGEGNIYYKDTLYGDVRIVAGDKKYPFGTIVKITGYKNLEPFYAIILDRGGAIGMDKKYQFDLLFINQADARSMGTSKDTIFEIIRIGY